MAFIEIYSDSRGFQNCRSCNAKMEWGMNVKTKKRIPFDAPIVSVQTKTEQATGRQIEIVDTHKCQSHFVTCPDREKWRRSK